MKLTHEKRNFFIATTGAALVVVYFIINTTHTKDLIINAKQVEKTYTDIAGRSSEDIYPWVDQAQVVDEISENELRCKVLDMGCFVLAPPKAGKKQNSVYTNISLQMTEYSKSGSSKAISPRKYCIQRCFQRKARIVGFGEASNSCYCSKSLGGFVTSAMVEMDVSSDRAKNCHNSQSVRVYMKFKDCEKGISPESIENEKVGCIEVPKSKLQGNTMALTLRNVTTQQCILSCEERNFPLAMLVQEVNSCICSDLNSMFRTAEVMHEAMLACPEDSEAAETNKTLSVYRTLAPDERCKPPKFLPKGKAGHILLASYPGSGNTWVRHLIETATGYYTGSEYIDKRLFEGGLGGEMLPADTGNARVIAIKDHLLTYQVLRHYESAILLIRNPYNAMLSEYTRKRTHSHTGVARGDVYTSEDFKKYFDRRPKFWYKLAEVLLRNVSSTLVVYYEDIVEDPVRELRRIVNFLPNDLLGTNKNDLDGRLMCMNLDLKGNFRRPPKNLSQNLFDAHMRDAIDRYIMNFDDLMAKYKLPPVPNSYLLT